MQRSTSFFSLGVVVGVLLATFVFTYTAQDRDGKGESATVLKLAHGLDTGMTVRSGPWKPVLITRDIEPEANGEIYVSYRVWRAAVAEGESITLGESKNYNKTSEEETWRVMYGIAVKPQF